MNRWSILVIPILCASAADAEVVHLSNGYDVNCVRRELVGGMTRLHLDTGGFLDVPSQQISGYEPDPAQVLPEAPQPTSTTSAHGFTTPAAPAREEAATLMKLTIRDHIKFASEKTGVDPDFIESVVRAESGYNANAISSKGARGLMQLMPGTAASLGVHDSFDPKANIDAGSSYLRELLVRFDGDAIKALAAYNAGPKRVDQFKGVPPYRETQQYVARVIKDYNRRKLSSPSAASPDKRQRRSSGLTKKQPNTITGAEPRP